MFNRATKTGHLMPKMFILLQSYLLLFCCEAAAFCINRIYSKIRAGAGIEPETRFALRRSSSVRCKSPLRRAVSNLEYFYLQASS